MDTADDVDQLFAPAARSRKSNPPSAAPSAASSPAKPRGKVSSSAAGAVALYRSEHKLGYEDRVSDGFVDELSDGGVVVDCGRDERLQVFMQKALHKLKLRIATDQVTMLVAMALIVSEFLGRSGKHATDLSTRVDKRLLEVKGVDGRIPIGSLLGDNAKKKKVVGAGLPRHRALLFKALADFLDLTSSTLEREKPSGAGRPGGFGTPTWNTVRMGEEEFVVDLIHDPGALYEAGSSKHQEYLRLLSDIASGASSAQVSISRREELAGKVPRPTFHVNPEEIQMGKGDKNCLGKGGFGEVWKATWCGIKVAVKVVKDKNPTDYDILEFILEIALLSRLNHPNVMRFWRACADMLGERHLLMVTEFIEKGGLSGLLHGHGGMKMPKPFSLPQGLWMAVGMARGMQYLHSCKVLHLDLKSPNVLVEGDWTPKLCDFGLAKITSKETEAGLQTTLRGVSPIWAPPEMFDDRNEGMTDKADVYSFGILLFEVVSSQLPFQEIRQRDLPRAKYDGVLPQLPGDYPQDCGTLVLDSCKVKPMERPTMSGVLARLADIAESRKIDLEIVIMPEWQQASEIRKEAGAAKELRSQAKTVEEEKERLLLMLEQAREKRRRLMEQHLGESISRDNLTPLLRAAKPDSPNVGEPPPGARKNKDKAVPVAESTPSPTAQQTEPPPQGKKCCITM